jgi:hypothetical protein
MEQPYQWQMRLLEKYINVEFKMLFTGQEQEGYKVVDGIEASFTLANGTMQFEHYNLEEISDE